MTARRLTFATPEDLEQHFYTAIARHDIEALMACWAEDEEIVCIHPTGQQLIGHQAIRASWLAVFTATHFQIAITPVSQWQGMMVATHHQLEMLLVGDEQTPHGPLHVTHTFVRNEHGWRLVCRHASANASDDEAEAMTQQSQQHTLH